MKKGLKKKVNGRAGERKSKENQLGGLYCRASMPSASSGIDRRKLYLDDQAARRPISQTERAFMALLDDALGDRQTETKPAMGSTGSGFISFEEGLHHARLEFFRQAGAVVAHPYQNPAIGRAL